MSVGKPIGGVNERTNLPVWITSLSITICPGSAKSAQKLNAFLSSSDSLILCIVLHSSSTSSISFLRRPTTHTRAPR